MAQEETDLCLFDGNPDLYGLGIRLGVYFQLLSTFLASHMLPNEISAAWNTNGIFLLAVFAAVAKATVEHSILYAEVFVMLQLMFAFLLAVARTDSRWKSWLLEVAGIMEEKDVQFLQKNFSSSKLGNSWRAGLAMAIACYNVWFWFMFQTPASCRAYIFLFAKASPQSTSQQIYRILAILYLIWRGIRYLIGSFAYLSALVLLLHKSGKKSDWNWPSPRHLWSSLLNFYYYRGKKGDEEAIKRTLQRHQ